MDPKNLSQLDPKLREVYERVMGTSVNPVKPTPPSNAASPTANAAPTPPQNLSTSPPASPNRGELGGPTIEPIPPQPEKPILQPIMASSPTSLPASNEAPQLSKVEMTIKPKTKISPLIIGLAAVAFLLVYALVWVKVFNLQLPFLP